MNPAFVKLSKLFLVANLLIFPFYIFLWLFPSRSSASGPPITPVFFNPNQVRPGQYSKSKFANLLAQASPEVLGAQITEINSEASPPITETKENNSPPPASTKKGSYTVAVLGDSMIDTMQPSLPQLKAALKKYYPGAQFKLLNYGVGASNIELGLERLTSSYAYLGQQFPPLLSQNPDLIIVESFAYNHWDNNQAGLDRQWLALGGIIETIRKQSRAKIVLAATIAPDENTLCDGIDGIHLPPDQKRAKAVTIRAYLQNLVNFATSQGYPLADAYHASLDNSGNGQPAYVNAGDHLHPSGPGGELFAQKIAEAIFQNSLL